LESEIPSNLPPILCDTTRIRQVVLNLLGNAGRFTETGGVYIKAWHENEMILVSIKDTGPGIAQEEQKKLFEPFQQLDNSKPSNYGSSGLGLSISKRFVELHGGKIWLESKLSIGTTITFSLPLDAMLPSILSHDDAKRWFNPYIEFQPRTSGLNFGDSASRPRFVLLEKNGTLQRLFSIYTKNIEIIPVQDSMKAIHALNKSPACSLIVNDPSSGNEMSVSLDILSNLPLGTPAIICRVPGETEMNGPGNVVHRLVKPVTRDALLSLFDVLGMGVKRVLLVDDESEVLQFMSRVLSSGTKSFTIMRAKNGHRAIQLLKERLPDIMLLDMLMPGMDGFQVLQEMSQDPSIRDIPVVIVSSRDPDGEPIVSNSLTVTCKGGITIPNLLACIQMISQVLAPPVETPLITLSER
jgi:CheY-like chemotaxis protein